MTFKQAFSALGMVDKNKPLKQLTDEETFSALANWAIHKLPKLHSMTLRITYGAVYQTVLLKTQSNLRVGKLVKVTEPGGIAYDWPESTRYESLDVSVIEDSVHRANVSNVERGYDLSAIERTQQAQEQADDLIMEESSQEQQAAENIDEEIQPEEESPNAIPWEIPKFTMRQTGPDCWEVVLTEDERELIDEFLEI